MLEGEKDATTPFTTTAEQLNGMNSPPENSTSDRQSVESDATPKTTKMTTDTPITDSVQNLHIDTNVRTPSPQKNLPTTPPPPEPPASSEKPYIDPTPKTPSISRRPSEHSSANAAGGKEMELDTGAVEGTESARPREDVDNESISEIQSIIEQFTDESVAPTREEIMSPRHEVSNPLLGESVSFPPRRSSLEPLRSRDMDVIAHSPVATKSEKMPLSPPPVPPKADSASLKSTSASGQNASTTSLPNQLPEPEPEPELPFDFHRFLEQLRHKSADPVAGFLRSFLTEFGKRQWVVHEQVKIISDFLAFITGKMAQCEVWREVSDTEFDNAKEGMEKLVMNRLYSQTFSPAIPAPTQSSRGRGKRKDSERNATGRRGQHQEDIERDEILAQKIRIYNWVREEHLDIAPIGPNGERFLRLAQQELLKIKGYRAPRDKIICILNCCKVIFGLLKNSQSSDTSADSFVPLLIFVVLQANPEHMVSNIQYILRFRNQDKLGGEAGYYLSSLSGAVTFIESLDRTTLTVSDEEFERNVELAVSAIAEQNRATESLDLGSQSEKKGFSEPEVTPRNSVDLLSSSPRKTTSRGPQSRVSTSSPSDGADDGPAAGLFKTIQKPLSTIGRMFSDQDSSSVDHNDASSSTKKLSPVMSPRGHEISEKVDQPRSSGGLEAPSVRVRSYDAQEAAARQASAEAAEARRIQRAEHRTVVDTLCGMFPDLDREVIDDVVEQKQGRVGLAVDACLALTAGI